MLHLGGTIVERSRLSNGIRVVIENMPSSRSVSFGIWVKVGSRNENITTNGISHFIEHMLFKGTDRFSAKDIANVFDGIGGNVNAFTTKEYTCYYAKVLDQHVPIAVDLLSDMFVHSALNIEELNKEKRVIMEEISMYEDTPDDMVHDLIAKASYGDHSLGYPILGTSINLQMMTSDDLRSHIEQHYGIDSIVISAAGNIDSSILDLFEKYFGSYAITTKSAPIHGPTFVHHHQYFKKKTEQNHICISLPGCALDDSLLYAMILLNNTIGGGMSSRLFQEIREKRGLAYSIYSYHSSHLDCGLFTIYAGTASNQTAFVLDLIHEIMEDIRVKGITADELARGKEQMKGSLIIGLESTSSRMTRNGKNELVHDQHFSLNELIERIESVSLYEIELVSKRMFNANYATAMVGNSDQKLLKWRERNAISV
jgi:predicted Zn-dependent peptidase